MTDGFLRGSDISQLGQYLGDLVIPLLIILSVYEV